MFWCLWVVYWKYFAKSGYVEENKNVFQLGIGAENNLIERMHIYKMNTEGNAEALREEPEDLIRCAKECVLFFAMELELMWKAGKILKDNK